MTRRNWDRANQQDRARRHGTESASTLPGVMAPILAQQRAARAREPAVAPRPGPPELLVEPVEIAKFWKNRRGDAVIVQLREYEGHALVDVRQNYTAADGTLKPTGKGLALAVLRLPDLRKAIVKAEARAIELGLLGAGDRDGD